MKIHNKTNVLATYGIYTPDSSDCGTVAPNATQNLPQFNDVPSVEVKFSFHHGSPSVKTAGDGDATIAVFASD